MTPTHRAGTRQEELPVVAAAPCAPAPTDWAALAAAALGASWPHRRSAALQLASACSDPCAVAWFWTVARTAGDAELAELVDRLPDDLALTSYAVVVLADDLAAACTAARAPSHAAVLDRLRPAHCGTSDLSTLVASAPGVDHGVLGAALRQLAAAGHPSRAVLLRVAARAVDEGAAAHARALLRSMVGLDDDGVPPRLLALVTPPPAGTADEEPPLPPAGGPATSPAVVPAVVPAARPWWRRR